MSTLTGNKISLTYKSLFKTSDNDVLTAALKQMSDGLGNNSGVYLNTGGDLKSTGTLEFANFKGTSTAVTINKLVNEADGISNNDNDTSLPTSAAVKDYVDTHVTSQDLDFSDGTTQSAVDLDSQVFAIVGTTNEIETTASGQQLQIGLPNSVTISGTYTGATFSGDLNGTINTATTATTQSAGDNSTKVATTAYVDTLDAASDLDFSGTTGTGDVNLNTQTFAVTGTTNQITTAASNQGLQISLLSTGVTMPNNSVATTQSAGDNSTKLATTAYVDVLDAASDLDIAGDSGTGDVNLNTQTFTLSGTTNQVTTAVSGQTATFSLPSTIHRNLQGNVTGDLTGNADTATKWQTARNLSVSGEATGTISNVDGSSAVSGAVTLTNSAVIGKVLTGLPTPAAGNIQASDSILEAFGKLQSQVSSISNGLIFKGSWDADTNTPTLTSGGGEVESGTTDGATTAFKLIDSSQNFNTTVSIGNKVINQVDGTTALVTVIDSNTQLTLDTNIMLTGEAYTIDASPFIPQGNYYVVNYAGNTNLNGTTDWSIGDWVIADADNRWSKLDHSQVDGQGSPGHLPVFATATTIGDSIVSQVGTALTITGSATTTLGLSSTGNFAVNTNKFTANATTGNTAFTGDLAINTNKFTVNATTGNTLVAGTLDVTSTSIFTGQINVGSVIPRIDSTFSLGSNALRFASIYGDGLTITNNSTFGGNVGVDLVLTVGNNLRVTGAGNANDPFLTPANDTNTGIYFPGSGKIGIGGTGGLEVENGVTFGGGGTFAGTVDINGGLTISPNTAGKDTFTFTTNASNDGRLLIKSVDTVKVDIQANGDSYFNGGKVGIGSGSNTLVYPLEVYGGNGDAILFKDTTNSVTNWFGAFGGAAVIGALTDDDLALYAGAAERMRIDSSGNVTVGNSSYGSSLGQVRIINDAASNPASLSLMGYNNVADGGNYASIDLAMQSSGTGGQVVASIRGLAEGTGENASDLGFYTATGGTLTERMRISASGNVGIGQAPTDFADWRVLELKGLTNGSMLNFENSSSVRTGAIAMNDASSLLRLQTMTASGIAFEPNNAEAMRIDSLGQVGIGAPALPTDVYTATGGGYAVLGLGQSSFLTAYKADDSIELCQNTYVNTSGANNAVVASVPAARLTLVDGKFVFTTLQTAANYSQTAVNAMEINASAQVGIGVSPTQIFEVRCASDKHFTLSDDSGTIKLKAHNNGASAFIPMSIEASTVNIQKDTAGLAYFGGQVAIGDPTPNSGGKLDIVGGFIANGYNSNGRSTFDGATDQNLTITVNQSQANIQPVIYFKGSNGGATPTTYASMDVSGLSVSGTISSGGNQRFGAGPAHGNSSSPGITTKATTTSGVYWDGTGAGGWGGGNFTTNNSDRNMKTNIVPMDINALKIIDSLETKYFNWTEKANRGDTSIRKAGIIAQDLKELMPEGVYGTEWKDDDKECNGLSLDENATTALLIKAIQELKAEVDLLKQECKCK